MDVTCTSLELELLAKLALGDEVAHLDGVALKVTTTLDISLSRSRL